ncbi:MAG: Metallo-beta-lactamase superfamily [Herbinix sp.]|jgi:7,8-dihydropterin-6-yl-methyl-4-(beta-D-ribofuranosyl)aminobenzene 5'-phosphate synthase|nr:Metallo-beta-lactamase superfamily [Herbinix sp.]
MRITALVENETEGELKAKHGIALYIETLKHKILFDLGPDNTLFENARIKGINLSEVDTVIISHGHMDHGGALGQFLEVNTKAKIYIQRQAFQPHSSKLLFLKVGIGLDHQFEHHPRVTLIDGDYQIDDELELYTVSNTDKCYSAANDVLFENKQKDRFTHEQNLIIKEKQTVLIMGCGHTGIINILEKAELYEPKLCIGGYHLFNPISRKTVSTELLDEIATQLLRYPEITFYTCHCTGDSAFQYLSNKIVNMYRLRCGQTIEA